MLDKKGKAKPQLATVIPSFENGRAKKIGKGSQIQALWEILPGARWGDGRPLTCRDFAFAKEVASHKNTSVPARKTYTQVDRISWNPKEPKKCLFIHKKAKWYFSKLFSFYPLPEHIERPVFEKYKKISEAYEKNSNYTRNPTLPGLYNGPYRISQLSLGSHVVFTPNPYFYGPKPKIKKIIVKLIPNTGTLQANLLSGNIDFISKIGLSFDQALALEELVRQKKLPYRVHFKESLFYEHISFNLDNPYLKNKKVRQALIHAINREELSQSLFDGKQKVALHFIAPMDPWFTKNKKMIQLYPYNLSKAKSLLKEAGWKSGPNGYRYNSKGKKLRLTLLSTTGHKTRDLVGVYLKEQWKKAGVDLNLKSQPARVFVGETLRKRKFSSMAMYARISAPEQIPRSFLHSQSIPRPENNWSGGNSKGWNSPQTDLLIEKLETEWDSQKRKNLAGQILKIYTREIPAIPLYYRSEVSVTPQNLTGYNLFSHGFPPTIEVEFWNLIQ